MTLDVRGSLSIGFLSICATYLFLDGHIFNFENIRDIGAYTISRIFPLEQKLLFSTQGYNSNLEKYKEQEFRINTHTVFLGDSLTAHFQLSKYFTELTTFNGGIYGDTTEGLLRRVNPNNFTKVNKIVLLIGYNDLKYRDKTSIVRNIRTLTTRLPSSHFYILSILPINSHRIWFNKKIYDTNVLIKKLSNYPSITFINTHAQFLNTDGGMQQSLSTDGTHLNAKGYQLLTKIITNEATIF